MRYDNNHVDRAVLWRRVLWVYDVCLVIPGARVYVNAAASAARHEIRAMCGMVVNASIAEGSGTLTTIGRVAFANAAAGKETKAMIWKVTRKTRNGVAGCAGR